MVVFSYFCPTIESMSWQEGTKRALKNFFFTKTLEFVNLFTVLRTVEDLFTLKPFRALSVFFRVKILPNYDTSTKNHVLAVIQSNGTTNKSGEKTDQICLGIDSDKSLRNLNTFFIRHGIQVCNSKKVVSESIT